MTRAEELEAIEQAKREGRVTKLPAIRAPELRAVRSLGSPYLAPAGGDSLLFFTSGLRVCPKPGAE